MRTYVMLGSLLVVGLLMAPPARACSCAPPPPPRQALAQADAVFLGLAVETIRDAEGINDGHLFATITVDKTWKGNVGEQVVVRTAPNSALCGFYFEQGERYLIYAYRNEDGTLRTHSCSRTTRFERAGIDILALDDLFIDDDDGFCGGPTNVAALQAMAFVFLVVALRQRRRA